MEAFTRRLHCARIEMESHLISISIRNWEWQFLLSANHCRIKGLLSLAEYIRFYLYCSRIPPLFAFQKNIKIIY